MDIWNRNVGIWNPALSAGKLFILRDKSAMLIMLPNLHQGEHAVTNDLLVNYIT